ncbi:MAG: IS1380 family transposase [bacterium]|nr:IS1380 family transposase [bacterium]
MSRFAGLVVFQPLFQALKLKERFSRCFHHLDGVASYSHGSLFMLLVVQVLLGFRRLRALAWLRNDPVVRRVVGLARLPDPATMSRMLSGADARSVAAVRAVSRNLVLDRLEQEQLRVVTLDFDGTVQSTKGHAQGTAVGFNKKKRGHRSYYPLLCTIAQHAQVLDLHHRSGNVHDSNGARSFIEACHGEVRSRLPNARIEARFDSAFFQTALLEDLAARGVEFTGSVPFHRFVALKKIVEDTSDWRSINETWSSAPCNWKPKKWKNGYRMLLFRKKSVKQRKGPMQLDLFEPRDFGFEYKVVVTNKMSVPSTILRFHNGRGSQEKLIGECKQHAALDVIATRTRNGNELFTLAGFVAHNLARELQMRAERPTRGTWPKRPARWAFESLGSIRQRLLLCAGRLVRPQGRLTLKMSVAGDAQADIERYAKAS